ncbi:MAG: OmpA family protein [Saprospiraceae bacterium]|nr:OmpA family protein [Saprospiraceae bacterium]
MSLLAQDATDVFDVTVKNESNINSDELEFSAAFFEDGILFISSREDVFKYIDRRMRDNTFGMYSAKRGSDGQLQKPEMFANRLNTKYHEGPLCFDMSGNDLFFTRSNYLKGKLKKSEDGWVKLRILKATRSGDTWGDAVDLPFNGDDFETCHPSLTPDGDRLYFASDRPGGLGGLDIYYVDRNGGDWGDPVNLGATVNTSSDDVFPFIHADGHLFFSTEGWEGLGGLDIFYSSQNEDGSWKQAQDLNAPFNSDKDDFGLILDLETKNGYFSSDRTGGHGKDDIYSFYASKGLTTLLNDRAMANAAKPRPFSVFVADNSSGAELAGADIAFLDLEEMNLSNILTITDENGNLIRIQAPDPNSNELILKVEMADSEIKGVTNDEGQFAANVPPSNYVIAVNADGYFPKQVPVEKADFPEEIMVLLEPMGDVVPFRGIVLDPRYNTPIAGAKVTIQEEGTSEAVVLYTDQNGEFNYYLPRDRDFDVTIEKDDMKATRKVSTKDMEPGSELSIAFDITDPNGRNPFASGNVITLPNIYYNFNDASIRPDAKPDLNGLATILKQFPKLKIELASHTDSRGSSAYNAILSQRRAESALKYLKTQGVAPDRLTAKGYGEDQLKNACGDGVKCSETEHQINRRTEFRILGDSPVEVKYANNEPSVIDRSGANSSTSSSSSSSTPSASSSSESGTFDVIAGTFKVLANAENRLAQVKELGYTTASMRATGNGMNAILIGTFTSESEAVSTVSTLEGQHSINAYVRRK